MDPRAILIIAGFLAMLGSFVGGYLKGGADRDARWEAATERLKAEAAGTLAAETAKAAEKDAANAELANRLDQANADAAAVAASTAADFDRRLRQARRGARCSSTAAVTAPDPGERADAAESRNDGSGNADPGNRLRDAALELQRYAVACHAWAMEIGR